MSDRFVCVCMCELHQKKAKQSAMGQGPIDEIDFCFFLGREEGGDIPPFLPPSNSLAQ